LRVVEMRTFVGPESPPSDKNYLSDIRRWYVKLFAKDDLTFQGRFLVEDRRFGRGLSAVAPYDTRGFVAPDWVGFQYQDEHPEALSSSSSVETSSGARPSPTLCGTATASPRPRTSSRCCRSGSSRSWI